MLLEERLASAKEILALTAGAGDKDTARSCFQNGLEQRRNTHSLQLLSMLARQMPGTQIHALPLGRITCRSENRGDKEGGAAGERGAGQGCRGAGRVVRPLVVHPWYAGTGALFVNIPAGNAYLSMFFHAMERVDELGHAVAAFRHAQADPSEDRNNPDLHHNMATVR